MESNEILEQETNLEQPKEQPKEQQEQEQQEQFQWDAELFNQLVQTPEGKKEIQRAIDKNFTKGLETWKTNNLEKLVNERYEQLHPTDPREKEILKLKTELAQKQIQNETIRMLEKAEIPVSFCDYFKSDNLETAQSTINTFVEHFNKAVNREVTKRLPGMTPRTGEQQSFNWVTKEQFIEMSYSDRADFYTNHPEEYQRIMGK